MYGRHIEYNLGVSSPGGFEFVRRTTSKKEADAWVMTPTNVENTMNVYGKVKHSLVPQRQRDSA